MIRTQISGSTVRKLGNTVAAGGDWGYSQAMTETFHTDVSAAELAEQIKDRIGAREATVLASKHQFARIYVELANGQGFAIQVEEC